MDNKILAEIEAETRATEYLEGAKWELITDNLRKGWYGYYWVWDGTGVYESYYSEGKFRTEEGHTIPATHYAPYCVPRPPTGEEISD